MFDGLLQWMGEQSRPFFVMANITNTHYHWAPPPDLLWRELGLGIPGLRSAELRTLQPWQFNSRRKQVTDHHRHVWQALYDASIRHVDREWRRFLRKLQKKAVWGELILLVTADHGELLGDHRNIVGHMLSLHDHLLHVPLIVQHPDYPGSQVIDNVVQTVDLYSSVLEWSGLDRPEVPGAQLQCLPLSSALGGPRERLAFAEEDYTDSYDPVSALERSNPAFDASAVYPEKRVAVHDGTYKLIWNNRGTPELFHVAADPQEAENLAQQDFVIPIRAKLEAALAEWERNKVVFPPQEMTMSGQDPQMNAHLRALGYLP
jgi:arylsulfatase A-like enzyme